MQETRRRWERHTFKQHLVAKMNGAHLLPMVKIHLFDVSTGGFGFTSSWKLKETVAELHIQSFPVMMGRIVFRSEITIENSKVFRYGFELSHCMSETQVKKFTKF